MFRVGAKIYFLIINDVKSPGKFIDLSLNASLKSFPSVPLNMSLQDAPVKHPHN